MRRTPNNLDKLKAAKGRTNELTKSVLDLLRSCGFLAWRSNNIPPTYLDANGKRQFRSFNGLRGVSDILAVACGRKSDNGLHGAGVVWACEIKTCSDTQSVWQKEFQRQIEARGGIYILVKDNTESLIDRLRGEGYL